MRPWIRRPPRITRAFNSLSANARSVIERAVPTKQERVLHRRTRFFVPAEIYRAGDKAIKKDGTLDRVKVREFVLNLELFAFEFRYEVIVG